MPRASPKPQPTGAPCPSRSACLRRPCNNSPSAAMKFASGANTQQYRWAAAKPSCTTPRPRPTMAPPIRGRMGRLSPSRSRHNRVCQLYPGNIILPWYNKLMIAPRPTTCIAFAGTKRIASGNLRQVALKAKVVSDRDRWAQVLIFDDVTSNLIEVDFRGTPRDVAGRLAKEAVNAMPSQEPAIAEGDPRGPGRPRLGVVGREVTLLPRHWDWLDSQPGGASVALRKLVEEARRSNWWTDRARQSQEAVHRFMYAMAGNLPGFEEASPAFYGRDKQLD